MPRQKKNSSVIAVCIQEPFEDGSSMDLGSIQGDDLRFLHQAFISDTITHALDIETADTRLYYIDDTDRKRFVQIIHDYLQKKLTNQKAEAFKKRFNLFEQEKERWGIRAEKLFADCFASGYDNVLLVGSRTPTIRASMLKAALRKLETSDAVFGPTPEGRYYIIGMSGGARIQLSDFDWKSPSIYSEVVEALTAKGLAWSEQEIWYAVETTDELEMMVRDINQYRYEGDESTAIETEKVMERLLAKLGE
ncbi:MAG: DUF2064 domain-containing protein [candidate division Zixibacteria bacterium]|nr:DUF2064 domain-containing protein [candidate division Zixibacteria bacterium]MDH3936760.1 DUF2064 domain-containing protein [candidate division Zixibacteria bacterium]MDH4032788.1 DUF2064 domain-containing protein [candidate division Zixibacteria bacterium]